MRQYCVGRGRPVSVGRGDKLGKGLHYFVFVMSIVALHIHSPMRSVWSKERSSYWEEHIDPLQLRHTGKHLYTEIAIEAAISKNAK